MLCRQQYLKRHTIDDRSSRLDDHLHRHDFRLVGRGICRSSLHRVTNAKSTTGVFVGSCKRKMPMLYLLNFAISALLRLSAFLRWTRTG